MFDIVFQLMESSLDDGHSNGVRLHQIQEAADLCLHVSADIILENCNVEELGYDAYEIPESASPWMK